LGRKELQAGDAQGAIEHLQRSLELNAQQPSALGLLSQAFEEQKRIPEAIAASQKAISLEPYDPLLQKSLIDQLIAAQQYDKAVAAMESYLKDFPEDSFVRQMLTMAKQ
jgi:predicted Zn-dependent protease